MARVEVRQLTADHYISSYETLWEVIWHPGWFRRILGKCSMRRVVICNSNNNKVTYFVTGNKVPRWVVRAIESPVIGTLPEAKAL